MKNRKLIAAVAGGALLAGVLATPAMAAEGSTDATFTLANGALSITAPVPTAPATAVSIDGWSQDFLAEGTSVSGELGTTTVTDERNVTSGWSVSASSTAFEQVVGGLLVDTVPASAVGIKIQPSLITDVVVGTVSRLNDGIFSATGGTTGDVAGAIGNLDGAALGTLVSSLTDPLLSQNANNQVTFDPTVTVTVPPDTADGAYTATVTQTVL